MSPKSFDPHLLQDLVLTGLPVSRGLAIGPLTIIERGVPYIAEYCIFEDEVERELIRLQEAINMAKIQINELKQQVTQTSIAEDMIFLLDAHLQMLGDSRLTRGAQSRIRQDLINAESALEQEIIDIALDFEKIQSAYFAARIADIREVGARIIRNLMKKPAVVLSEIEVGAIIFADELTPAETALMDRSKIAAFATLHGGAEAHTAIIAKSLGIPAVLGVKELFKTIHELHLREKSLVIIDGNKGLVIVNPSPETLYKYRDKMNRHKQRQEDLLQKKNLPAITLDGVEITLEANLELPSEVDVVMKSGASGIGLFRSEFLFMNRKDIPSEDEQTEILKGLIQAMKGRPLTIRTLDIGNDKLPESFEDYQPSVQENLNPALGMRAIRLFLKRKEILQIQLAAILRAAVHGPVKIMIPMIATIEEVRQVRAILDHVYRDLKKRNIAVPEKMPPFGIMIEVPSAALMAADLAAEVDFFSIGSNDLTMYTLAADRDNEHLAYLYDFHHPAVLRLVKMTVDAAAQGAIELSLCGSVAGNVRDVFLLLGLGITRLSLPAKSIPYIKDRVRQINFAEATKAIEKLLKEKTVMFIVLMK